MKKLHVIIKKWKESAKIKICKMEKNIASAVCTIKKRFLMHKKIVFWGVIVIIVVALVQDWVPLIKDVIVAGAAIVASYVGLQGLSTWRRQLKGNTEYELAKRLMISVYELQSAIEGVRFNLMEYPEEPDLPEEKLKGLSKEQKKWHSLAQAYQRRWEPIPKARESLYVALLEAKAVWGQGVVEKVEPLNKLIAELFVTIQIHLEDLNPDNDEPQQEQNEKRRRKEVLWASGKDDGYNNRLKEVIAVLEEEMEPHLLRDYR